MRTITVKVSDKLRERMASITINWSEFIRRAIAERIEVEERKRTAAELLRSLEIHKLTVPKGFINRTIRETRQTR
ncbi:MAG: hypothetical protein QXK96_06725 [Candidatus Bathyarchaeia archaeon]